MPEVYSTERKLVKIAVIGSKGLPPKQGGIEHHCAELYPRIADQGHEIVLFARSSYTQHLSQQRQYLYNGVQIRNLPSVPLRGFDALFSSGLAAVLASKDDFDVIHFHALGPSLFIWIPRLFTRNTQCVVTCHGLDWQRAKWGQLSRRLIRLGETMAVRFAHKIAVVSEELETYFLKTYGKTTHYISNAPAPYGKSDPKYTFSQSLGLVRGRYILFLGRLVPEKCPDLLIRAFQRLCPAGWKLVLTGSSSDTSDYTIKLKKLIDQDSNILMTGSLYGEHLAEIVRGAGLFVLPSELEGLPLALLEAMSEGVPTIASDIPVHRHLLGSGRGLTFKVGNVDNCTAALSWALQNPTSMGEMAEKASRYIQANHSWDRIARDWLELYESLLTSSKVMCVSERLG